MRGRIQAVIAETFGLDPTLMYLTKPTFFSRINSTGAKTQHDEYWHPHIDKVTHINRAVAPATIDMLCERHPSGKYGGGGVGGHCMYELDVIQGLSFRNEGKRTFIAFLMTWLSNYLLT